jgi:Ca2+-binding EF-hand superfamily protein
MSRRQIEIKEEEIIEEEVPEKEKEITILSLRRRLHRPKFTEDELAQMKNDFESLDILKTGKIKPSTILLFAEKQDNFVDKNPFYYNALKQLNTEDNNKNGVIYEDFVTAVQKVIRDYNEDFDKWKDIFYIITDGHKEEVIDEELLSDTMRKMGFNVSDAEIKDMIEQLEGNVDEKKFCDIMRMINMRFQGQAIQQE